MQECHFRYGFSLGQDEVGLQNSRKIHIVFSLYDGWKEQNRHRENEDWRNSTRTYNLPKESLYSKYAIYESDSI
jgi:hypothetical protein